MNISAVSTWFNHEMKLPTGETFSTGVEGIQPQLVQQIANSEFNVLSKFQVFGGLFGSGLGYLFAESVSVQVFRRGIYFSVSIAILSIVLSIIVTGVASLIPLRIATAVDPAIVLRTGVHKRLSKV